MPGTGLSTPNQNHLIAALPDGEYQALAPALERVPMRLGELLYEAGQPQRHAWFPTTAVVSMHHVTATGASVESHGVGNDGMVGIALFMGADSMPSSAVVHTAGHGYRLDRQALLQAFERGGQLRRLLLRYTQAMITQITQTAACYRHHAIEQQLARWLLWVVERAPPGELVVTQEMVAHMLGVRRESITQAARSLQDGGCIRYRRGHISVLDPAGLRARACECHAVVTTELQRLLSQTLLRQPDAPTARH